MSRLQSSDFAPSIACLEDAWSELSQPSAADKDAPSILPNISSPQVSIPLADEVASSISLHQKPNCSTSSYRYYGETEDDVPHGVGIRIYTNSGSIEKGKFCNTEIGTLQAYVEALGGKLEIYARMGKKTHRLID